VYRVVKVAQHGAEPGAKKTHEIAILALLQNGLSEILVFSLCFLFYIYVMPSGVKLLRLSHQRRWSTVSKLDFTTTSMPALRCFVTLVDRCVLIAVVPTT
jgi:hypothetical protein